MKVKKEIKYLPIREFRELGLLLEINRTFLHPLGLALEVVVNDETGEESLSGVWDYREDPEGIVYGTLNKEKVKKAQEFIKTSHEKRLKTLGYIIQED